MPLLDTQHAVRIPVPTPREVVVTSPRIPGLEVRIPEHVVLQTAAGPLRWMSLDYNLLFRWFVGLAMDDRIWDPTVFTKNRERLLRGDIAPAFFERVRAQAEQRGLLSDEHFTVDGTLIDAWASLKSFKRKDAPPSSPDDPGNPTVNLHGERRSNATHASTTDPQALLYRRAIGVRPSCATKATSSWRIATGWRSTAGSPPPTATANGRRPSR
jgi:Transposase domain (DUF772)